MPGGKRLIKPNTNYRQGVNIMGKSILRRRAAAKKSVIGRFHCGRDAIAPIIAVKPQICRCQ